MRGVEIFTSSVVRLWKREALRSPASVVLMSPYLTSGIADSVIEATEAASTEVYTRFEAEIFASGASSIRTLKRLALGQYRLFHLDDLHAKIVLTRGFASIGSQNLTAGGTKNREATVALRAPHDVERARESLEAWKADARPISIDMIERMEAALPALRKDFLALQRRAKALDTAISTEARGFERLGRSRQTEKLRESIRLAPKASTSIDVVFRWLESGSGGQYPALKRRRADADLTQWVVAGERILLRKSTRYLTVFADTGRLAWSALNRGQISRLGTGQQNTLELAGRPYDVELYAPLPENGNVRITVRPAGSTSVGFSIYAWFSLGGLDVLSFKADPESDASRVLLARFRDDINSSAPGGFREGIWRTIVEPFRYNDTFEDISLAHMVEGTNLSVRVVRVKDHPVLVVSLND